MKVERKFSPWAGIDLVSHPGPSVKCCQKEKSNETRRRDRPVVANPAERSSDVKTTGFKE